MIRKQFYANILQNVKPSQISRRFFSSNITDPEEIAAKKQQQIRKQRKGLCAFLPEDCPTNPTYILFPGQGSQFVGMAKSLVDIPEAVEMFDIASEILGYIFVFFNFIQYFIFNGLKYN